MGIKAHFSVPLNTCVVGYLDNNLPNHTQISKIIDIYNNHTLLELDILQPGNATGTVGVFLYENGVEVKGLGDNAGKEYRKRAAVLMGEAPPGY